MSHLGHNRSHMDNVSDELSIKSILVKISQGSTQETQRTKRQLNICIKLHSDRDLSERGSS